VVEHNENSVRKMMSVQFRRDKESVECSWNKYGLERRWGVNF
jgi:hypothetical protein